MKIVPLAGFVALLVLVQTRALAGWDSQLLRWLDLWRPTDRSNVFDWIFRLGFADVNAAIALAWIVWLVARRRSLAVALVPFLLFPLIAAQAGLRVVVDQPAPDSRFAISRTFADQPLTHVLDQSDLATRQTFVAALAGSGQTQPDRGSFPSGHAARSLFLAFLVASQVKGRNGPTRPVGWRAAMTRALTVGCFLLAGLIGYSALYFGYHWPSDVLGGYLLGLVGWQLAEQVSKRRAVVERIIDRGSLSPRRR